MNSILSLLLMILTLTTATGQITTTKVASNENKFENAIYDSTKNFLGKEVNKYPGQELYLKGKAESLRKYGYDRFYVDLKKGNFEKGVYKCCAGFNSKYDELAGKYFKVLEIIKDPIVISIADKKAIASSINSLSFSSGIVSK